MSFFAKLFWGNWFPNKWLIGRKFYYWALLGFVGFLVSLTLFKFYPYLATFLVAIIVIFFRIITMEKMVCDEKC
jgi:hypothetical protein